MFRTAGGERPARKTFVLKASSLGSGRPTRELVALACTVMVLDSILVGALPPLLPYYTKELEIDSGLAGLLSASYSIGLLAGALPAGLLVSRLGGKRILISALVALAIASVGFGFGRAFEVLIVARTLGGIASAFAWTAVLAWLVAETAPRRRASLFGVIFAAAFVGFTLGPALGALAAAIGTRPTFGGFGIAAIIAAGWAASLRSSVHPAARPLSAYGALVRQPGVPYSLWLQAFPGVLSASTGLVGALRLAELGATATVIAGAFIAGSVVQAASSPIAGRWADRVGPLLPIRTGIIASAILTLLIGAPTHEVALGVIVVLALGFYAVTLAPATALLTGAVEDAGEDPTLGFALMNLAFAPAAIVGFVGAGVLRDTAGDMAALLAISAVCVLTVLIPTRLAGSRSALMTVPRDDIGG